MFRRLVTRPAAFQLSSVSLKQNSRACPQLVRSFHAGGARMEEKKDETVPLNMKTFTSDWRFALPLGITLAVPAISQQWIVLSEETQLLACFILFSSLVYTQAGAAISKSFEEKTAAIMAEHHAIENANISAVKALMETHQTRKAILEEARALYAGQAEMVNTLLQAKSAELRHAYRADTVAKLEQLVLMQEAHRAELKGAMSEAVTASVRSKFSEDKKLRAASLDAAIGALGGDAAAADPVPELFSKVLADFNAKVKSQQGQEITAAQLTAMMGEDLATLQSRVGADNFKVDLPASIKIGSPFKAGFK